MLVVLVFHILLNSLLVDNRIVEVYLLRQLILLLDIFLFKNFYLTHRIVRNEIKLWLNIQMERVLMLLTWPPKYKKYLDL